MDLHQILFQILTNVIQILCVVLSGFCINLISSKIQNTKLSKYMDYARMAVSAVEQTMGFDNGIEKKKAVKGFLTKKIGNTLSPEDLDNLIEASVYNLNLEQNAKTSEKNPPNGSNKYAL